MVKPNKPKSIQEIIKCGERIDLKVSIISVDANTVTITSVEDPDNTGRVERYHVIFEEAGFTIHGFLEVDGMYHKIVFPIGD